MKTIISGFIFLLFIGCGEGQSSTPTETLEQNGPESPILSEKSKVPPSIPSI